jgi:transcriptional regulator with XRE-family HTH domain|tara:strand:- start:1138 stop:1392 length:255 start_codon:yes stop_codon:yes gene_type:complete
MSTNITFPEWVKEQEELGRSKQDIADGLRVSITSLYRYLCRDRVPDRQVMLRIGEASEGRIDTLWFFGPRIEPRAKALPEAMAS